MHYSNINRKKKLMWTTLAGTINERFGGDLTPLQVENKWKSLERRYKKTKVKNNSSGHSKVVCDYEKSVISAQLPIFAVAFPAALKIA